MLVLLREVSLRHLLHSPLRSLLVAFGIALGVAMVVGTAAVNRSLVSSFEESVLRVAGRADLVVSGGEAGVPAELVEPIAAIPGVAHTAPSLEVDTQDAKDGSMVLVLGIDFLGDKHFLPFEVEDGEDVIEDPVAFVNDPRGILVSRALAARHGVTTGGEIELLSAEGAKRFLVRGILKDEGPAATFGGQVAVMFLLAAQASFGRGELVDKIDVALAEGAEKDGVRRRIELLVEGRARVEPPEGRSKRLGAVIAPFRVSIRLSGLIAIFVGMFLVYNAVGVAVVQRRREVGILRALGVLEREVVLLFCLELGVLSIAGSALGLVVAGVVARIAMAQSASTVSRFYKPIIPEAPRIDLDLAVLGIAAGVVATVLAAYFPARRGAKLDPVETIRRAHTSSHASRVPYRALAIAGVLAMLPTYLGARGAEAGIGVGFLATFLLMLGAALIVPALLLGLSRGMAGAAEAVMGVPGRLAVDSVRRSLGRSALTVAALMLSVASSLTVGSWSASLERSALEWIDQAVPADIFVSRGSPLADQHNVPMGSDAQARLAGVPGVAGTNTMRRCRQEYGSGRLEIASRDTLPFYEELARRGLSPRIVDGKAPIAPGELAERPMIVISENAALRHGLHAGDTMRFATPHGVRAFEVRAVVVDYASDQGFGMIDKRWYVEGWGDTLIDVVELYLAPGADAAAVAREVRARLGAAGLYVTPAAELRVEIRKAIVDAMAVLRSSDIVALLVALLGVVGTMLAAVLDRVREIGLLRAVGATRGQVAAAIVGEASFLGFASALTGLLVAVPTGLVFIHVVSVAATGWRLDFVYPTAQAVRAAIAVTLTAGVAGLFPARRAAALDVPEALSYE